MKTFIIHLSKIKNSAYHANDLFHKLISFGMEDVTLFEGSYPYETEKLFEKTKRVPKKTYVCRKKNKIVSDTRVNKAGVKGCFLSHYRLWKECVQLNEPILILEDDLDLYRKLVIPKNWNMKTNSVLLVGLSDYFVTLNSEKKYLSYLSEKENLNPVALKYHGYHIPGAVAYVITPLAASRLVDSYANTFTAADHAINLSVIGHIFVSTGIIGISKGEQDGKRSIRKVGF